MTPLLRAAAILACASSAATAQEALAPVEIREWPVPWEDTRPRDPIVDAQHHVWFVGQGGNYVGMLDPVSGEFVRRDLPQGAGPHNVIIGPDGALWYAGNRDAHIGRMDPVTGEVRKIAMPDASARDPHTLIFDDGGVLWFTVQGGNAIGRMQPDGSVQLVRPSVERARPYGIVVDGKGTPWVALFGTNRIASVNRETMELHEYELPEGARPRRLDTTSDGAVWYVDYARGALGRLEPATGGVREWPAPGGERSRPYAMAIDDRERVWFVETGGMPNRLVGFDPAEAEFFSVTPIPSGGGTVRHMVFYAPAREIWFGTDTNTLGAARVP